MVDETDVGLNELFEEESEVDTEVDKEVEAEVETEEEAKGEESADVETEAEEESEPPAEKEPTLIPVAVAQDLRQKIKDLKRENEELSKYKPQSSVEPDMYEDPEGWKAWNRQQIQNEYVSANEKAQRERVEESRSKMLEIEDYAEMETEFMVRVNYEPELRDLMLASSNPAKFAYEKGKEFKEAREQEVIDRYLSKNPKSKKAVPLRSLANETAPPNSSDKEEEEDLKEMFKGMGY